MRFLYFRCLRSEGRTCPSVPFPSLPFRSLLFPSRVGACLFLLLSEGAAGRRRRWLLSWLNVFFFSVFLCVSKGNSWFRRWWAVDSSGIHDVPLRLG